MVANKQIHLPKTNSLLQISQSKQTPETKHLDTCNYTKTNLQFKQSDVEGGWQQKKMAGINGYGEEN